MPYSEEYAKVIDNLKFDEMFVLPFVQKHLGDQAAAEIKKTWEEEVKSIPETASFEEKYEIAYSRLVWDSTYPLTLHIVDGLVTFT